MHPAPTLDTCDREPIHIPGHVQAHGALLAFNATGKVVFASANAAAVLGPDAPAAGQQLLPTHFGGAQTVHDAIAESLALSPDDGAMPQLNEAVLATGVFDLIVHRSGPLAVAEFEPRQETPEQAAAFAHKAHRGIDRLRRQRTLQALFDVAVQELRALTGFDRVMGYRFRHDGSGDVVAEDREASLEPFLNRRYPASDIPAQARRLYVVSTLRLIADVRSAPVAVQGTQAEPLDMSHSVLRSVSPVHIEYLTNMGVGASMSVSIVVNGQLWGLLACHHMGPRHVPYSVRMACDVLGQILAANAQSVLAGERAQRMASAASLRSRIVASMLHGDEAIAALAPEQAELRATFGAEAMVVADGSRLSVHGDIPHAAAQALVGWLNDPEVQLDGGVLALHSLVDTPAAVAAALGSWCGVLALRFDSFGPGWLVLLRREQIETIAWGGRPEKEYTTGPLGPRLTPRGSFAVWRETVRGTSVPWDGPDQEIARQLLDELARACSARNAEVSRARTQLLAVLGHDLRNPLQSISMAAHVLERGADGVKMGQRIQSSSSRMQRLISQVLDMSRLQGGLGLGFEFKPTDLAKLVNEVTDEVSLAHPETGFDRTVPAALVVDADPDRMAQLLGNLVSNARHHGTPGTTVKVHLEVVDGNVEMSVCNIGAPIPAETAATMFSAFKGAAGQNARNRGGLGLGLYIAAEIARGHGGTLDYHYAAPHVVFRARFPRRQAPTAP